jgi:succinate dehydrogenase hydrophobic anchor subunit
MENIWIHLETLLTLLAIIFVPWLVGTGLNKIIKDTDKTPGRTWGFGFTTILLIVLCVSFIYCLYSFIFNFYIKH